MLFSMHTDQHIKDAVNIFGYAYGYTRICQHFGEFKHKGQQLKVVQNSPNAGIQMFYMEPEWYNLKTMTSLRHPGFIKFHDHQYKIYGTHLEATKVWSHWIDSMNQVDEIWVGNNFAAESVVNSGVKTPVYVFEHGIDDMWQPYKRGQNAKIRFLHVDSGSPRKRADLVEQAFILLFGNNPDVELTLKYHSHESSSNSGISVLLPNIKKIYKTLSQDEMVQLFYDHDVLVYPSEGEGFGFIPLQALATGMPVISTGRWCSYEQYLLGNVIESTIGPTTYTGYFEGDVVLAEFDSLVSLMSEVYNSLSSQIDKFYKQAPKIHKAYNWQTRCDAMLKDLIKRVGIDAFKPTGLSAKNFRYIKYIGGGRYCTASGEKFDKDSRIQPIPIESYVNLISLSEFADATQDEIDSIEK
jgi:glycosyltransferase involved in cell wall biosynthesis